jgi:nitrogen regulatory protein PII
MKLIRCVLNLQDWETIVSTTSSVTTGMTARQIWQDSPETTRKGMYRGRAYDIHVPCVMVEIVTDDSWLDDVITKLTELQGLSGGGGIQVFPVEESYRIRDGFMLT